MEPQKVYLFVFVKSWTFSLTIDTKILTKGLNLFILGSKSWFGCTFAIDLFVAFSFLKMYVTCFVIFSKFLTKASRRISPLPNVVVEWLKLVSRFQISACRSAILTGFRGFSQSFYENAGIAPQIRPLPLPSTSFPFHHSPTLSLDAI
jgi:hypothetical protein